MKLSNLPIYETHAPESIGAWVSRIVRRNLADWPLWPGVCSIAVHHDARSIEYVAGRPPRRDKNGKRLPPNPEDTYFRFTVDGDGFLLSEARIAMSQRGLGNGQALWRCLTGVARDLGATRLSISDEAIEGVNEREGV